MSLKYRIISAVFAVLTIFSIFSCSDAADDLPPKVTVDGTTGNDTTKIPDTTEIPDTTTADTSDDEIDPDEEYTPPSVKTIIPSPVNVAFGESEISVTAYEVSGGHPYVTELDDTYLMLTIYGSDKRDISIKIINRHTGRMEADLPIDGDLAPSELYSVIEDGYVLYNAEYDPPGVVSRERFWTLTLKNGVFSITSSDTYTGNRRFYPCSSPDGNYLAYREYIPGEDIYGLFVEDADGNATLIAKDRPVYADHPDGWWLGYIPRGFLDNDTLIYNTGSEGTAEYGIYRISTKENTVFDRGYEVFGIIDGKAYVAGTNYASVYSVGTVDRDGNYTDIPVSDIYSRMVFAGEQNIMDTCGENWIFAPYVEYDASFPHQAPTFYLFSKDISTITAKIDMPSDRRIHRSFAGDGHLTLILSKKKETEQKENEITDVRQLASLLSMTAKEIREKYGVLTHQSVSTESTGLYSIKGLPGVFAGFSDWDSRYMNGYHLQVRGDLYPSYIRMSANSTGNIDIVNGSRIEAYANPSDFENAYYDDNGDVHMFLTFDGCILELCVDPDWDIYFPTADKEKIEAAFEKFKADPRGYVKSIILYAGEELRQELHETKKAEQNELIVELLSLTAQQIEEKYGALTETYFQNDRSAKMFYPAQLAGVSLTFDLPDGQVPSGSHTPDRVIINEFYDRSFMGMSIGSEISVFSPAESYYRALYLEDVGCFVSFEANGCAITLMTGGEGSAVGVGTEEWTEKYTQSPTGFIRAIIIEKSDSKS